MSINSNSKLCTGFCKCHSIFKKYSNKSSSVFTNKLVFEYFLCHPPITNIFDFFLLVCSHEAKKNFTQSPKREESVDI